MPRTPNFLIASACRETKLSNACRLIDKLQLLIANFAFNAMNGELGLFSKIFIIKASSISCKAMIVPIRPAISSGRPKSVSFSWVSGSCWSCFWVVKPMLAFPVSKRRRIRAVFFEWLLNGNKILWIGLLGRYLGIKYIGEHC